MKRYLQKVVYCKGEDYAEGGLPEDILAEGVPERVLYITDSEVCLQELKERKLPAAAWLHEGNRDQNLTAAAYAVEHPEELDMDFFEKIYRREKGIPWEILETERCLIREMIPEDAEAFAEIYREPAICRYMKDFHRDVEGERRYIEEYQQQYRFFEYGVWSIVLKETGEVIGRAGFSEAEDVVCPAKSGVFIAAERNLSAWKRADEPAMRKADALPVWRMDEPAIWRADISGETKEKEHLAEWLVSGEEETGLPQFGYMVGVTWQGRGIAYEVCSAILDYAREELGFRKVRLWTEER